MCLTLYARLFKTNFSGFRRFLIHGNTSYVVLYTQCLRYNICSVWFLDIRISTCFQKDKNLMGCTYKGADRLEIGHND